MANPKVRGVRSADERGVNYRRDTRRLGELFSDGFADPLTTAGALVLFAIGMIVLPGFAHFSPIIVLLILWVHSTHTRHRHLPMRLPLAASNMLDINSPLPGRRGFYKGRGLIYVGNAWERGNQEVWQSRDDECTHGLMLATTGSGKTVCLTGRAANYIGVGGGLIYSDAKASPSLAFDIAGICRRMGREDDLLLINYMTGNRSVAASGSGDRLTNTANPLASGSADSLVQIMSSLIPAPEGDNAVFGERALTMMTAVLYGLVDLRDGGHIDLGVSTLRDYLPLERLELLAFDSRLRTETAKNSLMSYMKSLPNWKPPSERVTVNARTNEIQRDADGKPKTEPIHEEAGRQHGFAQMYFTRSLSSLTDTYGHIFFGVLGEVDYGDVVRNRRVLVIMLPAAEKSLSELQNLGKINLSAIRDAVSAGLGSKIEGNKREVLDTLSAGSKVPNHIILDEAGYQSSPGFSVLAAQARSLLGGFAVMWAGQTWASIKRGSESEADEIWGNANIKYFGRLSDNESYQRLEALVGEAKITSTSGYAIKQESLTGGYADNLQASIEKMKRADFTDLQAQTEGEFHVVFGGEMVRVRTFYAALPTTPELRVNRYLRVGEKLALVMNAPPSANEAIPTTERGSPSAQQPTVRAQQPEAQAGPTARTRRSAAQQANEKSLTDEWHQPAPSRTHPSPDAPTMPVFDAPPMHSAASSKSFFDSISPETDEPSTHDGDLPEFMEAQHLSLDSRKAPGFSEFASDMLEQFGIAVPPADDGDESGAPFDDMPAYIHPDELFGEMEREQLERIVDSAVSAYPGPESVAELASTDPIAAVLATTIGLLRDMGDDPDKW